MPRQDRRLLLLSALALAATIGAGVPAAAAEKIIPANRVFQFLDAYLKLPQAERNRFSLAYYLHIGTQPLTAPVWLLDNGARTPVPINAKGRVERLPTLAQLADAKLLIGVDSSVKMGATLEIEASLPLTAGFDAAALSAAIAQAAVGSKKAAGIMAVAMPKLQGVGFVGAPSGEVEFADGRRAPLPLVKGVPTYTPTDMPNARRIHLPRPPERLSLG